jgi:hypothetical protein
MSLLLEDKNYYQFTKAFRQITCSVPRNCLETIKNEGLFEAFLNFCIRNQSREIMELIIQLWEF